MFDQSQVLNRLRIGRERKRQETGRCEGPSRYGGCDKRCIDGKHSDRCIKERATLEEMAKLRNRKPRPLSYSKIAAELNSKGIKPRQAERWTFMLVYQVLNKESQ